MEEIIHEIAHNNTCQTYFEETFEIDFKCSKEIAVIIKNLENAVSDQKITLRFKITKEEILADVFSKGPLVCKGLSDIKDQVQNEVLKYDRTWKSPLLFAIEQNLQNTYCIFSNYGAQIYYDPQND